MSFHSLANSNISSTILPKSIAADGMSMSKNVWNWRKDRARPSSLNAIISSAYGANTLSSARSLLASSPYIAISTTEKADNANADTLEKTPKATVPPVKPTNAPKNPKKRYTLTLSDPRGSSVCFRPPVKS